MNIASCPFLFSDALRECCRRRSGTENICEESAGAGDCKNDCDHDDGDDQKAEIGPCKVPEIAVLRSANMSLGVNLLLALVKEAAKTLAPNGFDIEILEKHHRRKIDAPSGTAIALADSINEAMDGAYHYRLDRSGVREKRDPKEIGIQAIRGGTIVGEHDVIFAGEDEVITFSHRAYSRAVFAKGAAEAAVFLAGKAAGMYDMKDVLGL